MEPIPKPRTLPTLVLARDLSPRAIRAMVSNGDVVRVGWGAYVRPIVGTVWEQRQHLMLARIAAVQSRLFPEQFAFADTTAAFLHGCWVVPDGDIHVLSPTRPRSQSAGIRRHVGEPGTDIDERPDGVRLTSLPRTILDCAERLSPRWALVTADIGIRILAQPDVFDRPASQARLDAARGELLDRLESRVGHRGVVQARVVSEYVDGWAASSGESSIRWVALAAGLPRPVCQFPVTVGGRSFFVDLAWPVKAQPPRLVLGEEYDGADKYVVTEGPRPDSVLVAEKVREDALRRQGVLTRRRMAADLLQPGVLFADMLSRFPRSLALGVRPLPGLYEPRSFQDA